MLTWRGREEGEGVLKPGDARALLSASFILGVFNLSSKVASMELQGSCRCGLVKFSCDSHTPCPYMRCYCSICRKVGGSGGFGINIMGQVLG